MNKKTFNAYLLLIFIGIVLFKLLDEPEILLQITSFFSELLTPFCIGIFVAIILSPIVRFMKYRLNFSRATSILLTYILALVVLGGVGVIIIPALAKSIQDLFTEFSFYMSDSQLLFDKLTEHIPHLEQSLEQSLIEISSYISDNLRTLSQSVMSVLNSLYTTVFGSVMGLTSQLINFIFGVTISIYLLIDEKKVVRGFRRFLTVYLPNQADRINYFVTFSYRLFQDYIVGRLLDSLIIGVLAYVGFTLLNSEYVALFSFIVFVTNIIPYFGPFIGAVPPILMTLLIDPIQAIWVALFILALQQLDGNVIGPKIMGDKVGLSPLWVVSAVIIGGGLFGFMGFFLAVPVFAIAKEFYDVMTDAKALQAEQLTVKSTIYVEQ